MLKDVLLEYGAPIAVSLTLALGGMGIKNTIGVAVLESETENMVQVQKEMIKEIKSLTIIISRVDGKLEAQNE